MPLIVVGAVCFCAVAALAQLERPFVAAPYRSVAALAMIASAVGAALAAGAPTGIVAWDVVLRGALGTVVVLAGWRCRPGALLSAAAVTTAVAPGSPLAPLAFAALAVTVVLTVSHLKSPTLGAGVAAVLMQVVLRLQWSPRSLESAAVSTAVIAIVVVGASPLAIRQASRWRTSLAWLGCGLIGLALCAAVTGAMALVRAKQPLVQAENHARAALGAADSRAALAHLDDASRSFRRASSRLDAWWARPALLVPVVGLQLRAVRSASHSGSNLVDAGAAVLGGAGASGLRLEHGHLDVGAVAAMAPEFQAAGDVLTDVEGRLRKVDSPWLVPALAQRFRQLVREVDKAQRASATGLLAARAAPALFGAGTAQRYFLAIETPSESRAAGGIIGNYGDFTVTGGHFVLDHLGRGSDLTFAGIPSNRHITGLPGYVTRYSEFQPAQVWQNVTASPDFPTVAEVISQLYPQSGGEPIDGVIAVDPFGLAGLLDLIGPVSVPGWPEPITASNAVPVLLHDQYLRLGDQSDRTDFLSQVASQVWDRLTATQLPGPLAIARSLGPAVHGKHLLLWDQSPTVERLFDSMGASGRMPPSSSDYLAVVTQNAGGNKIDWYLHRSVDCTVTVDPKTGRVRAALTISFRNDAPSSGLPAYVIGSVDGVTSTGANHMIVSIYTPWELTEGGAHVDGRPLLAEETQDVGLHLYTADVTVAPHSTARLTMNLQGEPAVSARNEHFFSLQLRSQPTIAPDDVRIAARVNSGWAIESGQGWTSRASRSVQVTDRTGADHILSFRVRTSRLFGLPWSLGTPIAK